MSLVHKLKWAVIRLFEGEIQTLITHRILDFRARLIEDGFIPDLKPPYPGRSSAGAIDPQGHVSSRRAFPDRTADQNRFG